MGHTEFNGEVTTRGIILSMEVSGSTLPRFELLWAAAEGVRLLEIYWPVSTKRHGVTPQNKQPSNLVCTGVYVTDNSVSYVGRTASNLDLLPVNEDV
jgi:hypothetical protein